ncbi:hypothetical protein QUA62_27920, partial [Microcoleus sp. MON1_C1]|uniref:hypothetical protein n=1 Tax=Microcoleus sp. MON1_C1 TaxID=2818827 RepID=UPI002FD0E60B
CLFFFSTHWLNPYKGMGFRLVVTPPGLSTHYYLIDCNDELSDIAILNDFLCISVLMNFGQIKFMFLSEELKQKFDNLKRPT